MKLISLKHVYTVEGTDKEISAFKSDLYNTYDDIDTVSTPFDTRLACNIPLPEDGLLYVLDVMRRAH